MGKFTIRSGSNGQYYFNLKAENGKVILVSEGYTTRAGCMNGIAAVRNNSNLDIRYNRKQSANGKFYFSLNAANGEIIGISEMYETIASLENGIDAVKNNAASAPINED